MSHRLIALAVLVAAISGCSSSSTRGAPLIPDRFVRLTPSQSLPLSSVVSGVLALAAVHAVYDPLAPNWEIEESRLDEETFHFSLRMKRYHTGGSGESVQVLRRRAAQLQKELRYGGYQVVEYSEGIDSQTLGARRVAEGTIKLVNRLTADSFLQEQP